MPRSNPGRRPGGCSLGITTARTLEVGPSHVLFEAPYFGSLSDHAHYDVFPDGERFIMMTRTDNEAVPTQINVVLDWMQELDRSTSEN